MHLKYIYLKKNENIRVLIAHYCQLSLVYTVDYGFKDHDINELTIDISKIDQFLSLFKHDLNFFLVRS